MSKTIISKRDLDALIRMHLNNVDHCSEVAPMPVVWRARSLGPCNWAVPGWTGDSHAVGKCLDRMRYELRTLRTSYDIPDEQ